MSVCYSVVRERFSHGPCVIMLERFRERPFPPGLNQDDRTTKRQSRILDLELVTAAAHCRDWACYFQGQWANMEARPTPLVPALGKGFCCREGQTLTIRLPASELRRSAGLEQT